VPVRGEDERDVEAFAGGVALGLVQAVAGGQFFLLGLDQGDGDGLRVRVDLDAQGVVDLAPGAAAALASEDLDGARRLLAADEVLGPAPPVQRRVDQLGSGVGFVEHHRLRTPPPPAAAEMPCPGENSLSMGVKRTSGSNYDAGIPVPQVGGPVLTAGKWGHRNGPDFLCVPAPFVVS
jgi:hypothetical protein